MAGVAKKLGWYPVAVNGMADHAHALVQTSGTEAIATVVQKLKANSSRWYSARQRGFAWQKGYGAFSVSASNVESVRRYIESQREHHRKRDFRQEYLALLEKHGIEIRDRVVFD